MSRSEARTVAFMDIGTHSIRLLVVRMHPDYSSTVLTQLKHMVRLGEGAFTHQHLQPDAINRAVLVARQFAQLARAHGAETIIAVATAATREAVNQSALVQQFGAWECELLEYTAWLHHIGAFLTYTNYQAHTYYLIKHANLLGFDQTEIAIMATTALYHRKALPRKKYPEFAVLDQRVRQIVRILSGLLRLAETLDRSHAGLIRDVRLYAVDTQHVALYINTAHDCQVEVRGVQKQLAAFQKVFGRQLVIRLRQQTSVNGVSVKRGRRAQPDGTAGAASLIISPQPTSE